MKRGENWACLPEILTQNSGNRHILLFVVITQQEFAFRLLRVNCGVFLPANTNDHLSAIPTLAAFSLRLIDSTFQQINLSLANIDLDKFKQLLATHIDGGAHLLLAVPLNGLISKPD
jgi:hypothetical protein